MAKPSIFSREYERKMKKRKLRIASAIIIILLVSLVFYVGGTNKNFLSGINFSGINFNRGNTAQTNKDTKNETSDKEQVVTPKPQEEVKEKSFDLQLSDGTKVKALYEEKQGGNIFKSIISENTSISFVANPSSTALVLIDNKVQSMWAVDGTGKVTEITNTGYNKASVLKKRPNYIWCDSPKFIDDVNVVYLSQLHSRVSNSTKKYVWAVNINNKDKHILSSKLSGEDIRLGNIVDGSLEVILGSTTKYIKISNNAINIVK